MRGRTADGGERGTLPAPTSCQAPAPVTGSTTYSSSWSMYSTPSGAPPCNSSNDFYGKINFFVNRYWQIHSEPLLLFLYNLGHKLDLLKFLNH